MCSTSSGSCPAGRQTDLDASAPARYRTADDKWIAVSSASPNIAKRVYRAVDRPDSRRPDYVDPIRRQERAARATGLVADWSGSARWTGR